MNSSIRKLHNWSDVLYQWRFYILLLCILPFLSLPGFFDLETNRRIIWPINRTLILLGSLNIIRKMHKGWILIFILGFVSTGTGWITRLEFDPSTGAYIGLMLFGIFIAIITAECLRQVSTAPKVDKHLIMGAIDGFMLIGLLGGIIYTFLHLQYPGSFSNVPEGMRGIMDLTYFSYITVLTIGYGDIVPLTEASRFFSIFLGLVGEFYIVVIMAILVGKYLYISKVNGNQ